MTSERVVDISLSKPAAAAKPTRVRKTVVWFGAAIAFLSFLDRAAISQSAPAISKELRLVTRPDGPSVFGIRIRLRRVRITKRLALRLARRANPVDARDSSVVAIYGGDGSRLEFFLAVRHAIDVRRRRIGMLLGARFGLPALVAAARNADRPKG